MAQVSTIGHSESALYIKCEEVEEETTIISCANAEIWLRTERPPTNITTDSTKMVLAPVLQTSNRFFTKESVCMGLGGRVDPPVTFGACTPPLLNVNAGMGRITTFRSTTERIYDGGPIIL